MIVGRLLSVFVCDPASSESEGLLLDYYTKRAEAYKTGVTLPRSLYVPRPIGASCACFHCSSAPTSFFLYQPNCGNGKTFDIRTRALNGAFHWMVQMTGDMLIELILDLHQPNRRLPAMLGWVILFVTGMAIWGDGYAFQVWSE